jgi:hypothetical protein
MIITDEGGQPIDNCINYSIMYRNRGDMWPDIAFQAPFRLHGSGGKLPGGAMTHNTPSIGV